MTTLEAIVREINRQHASNISPVIYGDKTEYLVFLTGRLDLNALAGAIDENTKTNSKE